MIQHLAASGSRPPTAPTPPDLVADQEGRPFDLLAQPAITQ
ncbi:hypothetical protein [Candidatus Amarolinea dominans]